MKAYVYILLFLSLSITACVPKQFSDVDIKSPNLVWDNGYDYGDLNLGSVNTATFTLTNHGSFKAMGCGAIVLSDNVNFSVDLDNCKASIMNPGEQCTVDISSHPATVGVKNLTITRVCEEKALVNDQIIATGVSPQLDWDILTNDFGSYTIGDSSPPQAFTLSNSGTSAASGCSAATIDDNVNFTITADTCAAAPLSPSNSCIVAVSAHPTTSGLKSTTLSRVCTVGGTIETTSNQIIVMGIALPALDWNPLTRSFGNILAGTSSADQQFTFSNTGLGPATGCSAPTLSNSADFSISSENCGTSDLLPSSSCTADVRAVPSSAGLKTTTLSRTCTVGGVTSTTMNQITATGTAPTLSWSISTYDFGDARLTEPSLPVTVTLTNLGPGTALGCSAPQLSDATNFAIIEDNCSTANMNVSTSCTVKIHAFPLTGGAKSTTLSRTCAGGPTTTGSIVANALDLPANTIMKVAGGAHHTCSMTFDGNVKCWGTPNNGQMGYNEVTSRGHTPDTMANLPVVFLGTGKSARDIVAGYQFTCALLNDYTMKCWGENGNGQLGTGDNLNRGHQAGSMESLNAINVGAGRLVKKIAAGYQHTCAILDNDTLKCWGRNFTGALGLGGGDLNAPAPNAINFGTKTVKEVAVGYIYTCAILSDNTVSCWGYNNNGQLGQNNTSDYAFPSGPVDLGVGRTARKLALGWAHTCAILDTGDVKCWGVNNIGHSGVENNTNYGASGGSPMSSLPVVILGAGRTAKKISAMIHHTCALLDDDTMKCWGHNAYGQLGIDSMVNKGIAPLDMQNLLPIQLGAGRTAKDVMAGPFHSCAILDNNTLKCWGNNATGRLGYGDTATRAAYGPGFSIYGLLAINIGPSLTVKDFSVGNAETCAILSDNSLKCWGVNTNGKLGYNDTVTRGSTAGSMALLPSVYLGVGRTAVKVSAGATHTCVVLDNGGVKCWGLNTSGQLGYNDVVARGHVPGSMEALGEVYLGAGRTAVNVFAGSVHTCAHLDNGGVKCWGANSVGQLGQNNTTTRGNIANSMQGLAEINFGVGRYAVALSGGWTNNCAILDTTFELKCWGSNSVGELGYDDTTNRGITANSMENLLAVNLGAARYAVSVSAGQRQTCAVLDDGSSKCWGHGVQGNLGTGGVTSYGNAAGSMASLGFINYGVGRTAVQMSAGYSYTCAVLDDATSQCWGVATSSVSALGYNDTALRYSPAGAHIFRNNLTVKKIGASFADAYQFGHTCALLSDDSLTCWGYNSSGQLGIDDAVARGHQGYSITDTMPHGLNNP